MLLMKLSAKDDTGAFLALFSAALDSDQERDVSLHGVHWTGQGWDSAQERNVSLHGVHRTLQGRVWRALTEKCQLGIEVGGLDWDGYINHPAKET